MTEITFDQSHAREKISPPKFEIKKREAEMIGDSLVEFFDADDELFGLFSRKEILLKINGEEKTVRGGNIIEIGEKFFRAQLQFAENSNTVHKVILTENPKIEIGKKVREFLKDLFDKIKKFD